MASVVAPANQRIVTGAASAQLRAVIVDGDGEPLTGATAVTVAVTDDQGVTLATGSPVAVVGQAGAWSATLSAPILAPATLSAVWSVGGVVALTSAVSVVGARMLTCAALRRVRGLEDQTRYPDWRLDQVIAETETMAEQETGCAWVQRHSVLAMQRPISSLRWCTDSARSLRVPYLRSVRSISATDQTGAVVALSAYETDGEEITQGAPRGARVLASVVHGQDAPPADLRQALLLHAQYRLLGDSNAISPRATGYSSEAGTVSLSTMIPEVADTLKRYRRWTPGIA